MREFGKVYCAFWSSPTIERLSDDSKLLAVYLMTCQHNNIAGAFRLPEGYVCEDLGWAKERVTKGLHELSLNGFVRVCERTKWVWIIKHLEWNQPENPNQWKAVRKLALSVHDSCEWKLDFMQVCELVPANVPDPEDEPLRNRSETLSKQGEGEGEGETLGQPSVDPPVPRSKRPTVAKFPPGFEEFWSIYPRKVAKADAAKAFARLKPDPTLQALMLSALRAQSKSDQWTRERGQFIPHASTWLHQERWNDEIGSVVATDIFAGVA